MECATWRIGHHTGALAIAIRTTSIVALFARYTVHRLHVCRIDWQWSGVVGVYFVSNGCQIRVTCALLNFTFSLSCSQLTTTDHNNSSAKSLRTPSNVFVVNLAFCDFMMMTKTPIFIYNSFNRGYELGYTGCQVFAFVGSLSGIGAAITNACIAYDR